MHRVQFIAGMAGLAFALAACETVSENSAAVPDYTASPSYGTISLSSGFTPDPRVVAVQSGGRIPAANVSSSCSGYINGAPDVRLDYRAGDEYPLILSVASSTDTTLVVNAPDGSWYCDDDSGENGQNPRVRFNSPRSGQYDIWVGTYGGATQHSARLHISEVESQ